MMVWMYYTTDGDSGYYRVKLFSSKRKAEAYLAAHQHGYSHVDAVEVV